MWSALITTKKDCIYICTIYIYISRLNIVHYAIIKTPPVLLRKYATKFAVKNTLTIKTLYITMCKVGKSILKSEFKANFPSP